MFDYAGGIQHSPDMGDELAAPRETVNVLLHIVGRRRDPQPVGPEFRQPLPETKRPNSRFMFKASPQFQASRPDFSFSHICLWPHAAIALHPVELHYKHISCPRALEEAALAQRQSSMHSIWTVLWQHHNIPPVSLSLSSSTECSLPSSTECSSSQFSFLDCPISR